MRIGKRKRELDKLMRTAISRADPVIDVLEARLAELTRVAVAASGFPDVPADWRWGADGVPVSLPSNWAETSYANDYADQQRSGTPTLLSLVGCGDSPVVAVTGATVTTAAAVHIEVWSPRLVMNVLHTGVRLIDNYRQSCLRGDPLRVRVELVGAIYHFADGIRSDR